MDLASLSSLQAEGFGGFKSVRNLRASRCAEVPKSPGVYLVLRDPSRPPSFREASPGATSRTRTPPYRRPN